jgi:uncharacterized protein DUF429
MRRPGSRATSLAADALVFQAPSRRLLVCATEPDNGKPPKAKVIFERARELIVAEQARLDAEAPTAGESAAVLLRLTQQAAGILGKVAEIDEFMREQPAAGEPDRESWLVEVHPEMCFRAMAGGQMPPAKASAHGQLQRLDLVRAEFPDADDRIRTWDLGTQVQPARHLRRVRRLLERAPLGAHGRWRGGPSRPSLAAAGGPRETAPGEPVREPGTGLATRMVV